MFKTYPALKSRTLYSKASFNYIESRTAIILYMSHIGVCI